MAASGSGGTFLPSLFGEVDTRLKRSQDVDPKIEVPPWVATLEEIAQTPRFTFFQKALAESKSR